VMRKHVKGGRNKSCVENSYTALYTPDSINDLINLINAPSFWSDQLPSRPIRRQSGSSTSSLGGSKRLMRLVILDSGHVRKSVLVGKVYIPVPQCNGTLGKPLMGLPKSLSA
jgi:hypothetical protein